VKAAPQRSQALTESSAFQTARTPPAVAPPPAAPLLPAWPPTLPDDPPAVAGPVASKTTLLEGLMCAVLALLIARVDMAP